MSPLFKKYFTAITLGALCSMSTPQVNAYKKMLTYQAIESLAIVAVTGTALAIITYPFYWIGNGLSTLNQMKKFPSEWATELSQLDTKEVSIIFTNLEKIQKKNTSNIELIEGITTILSSPTGKKLISISSKAINTAEVAIPIALAIEDFKKNPGIFTACNVLSMAQQKPNTINSEFPDIVNVASAYQAGQKVIATGDIKEYSKTRNSHTLYWNTCKTLATLTGIALYGAFAHYVYNNLYAN